MSQEEEPSIVPKTHLEKAATVSMLLFGLFITPLGIVLFLVMDPVGFAIADLLLVSLGLSSIGLHLASKKQLTPSLALVLAIAFIVAFSFSVPVIMTPVQNVPFCFGTVESQSITYHYLGIGVHIDVVHCL